MSEEKEQQEKLKEWSTTRDALLSELYINKIENEKLVGDIQSLKVNKKELEIKISDLTEKEKLLIEGIEEKNRLLSDIPKIRSEYNQLFNQKTELSNLILSEEEKVQLNSWVGQRDAILVDIAVLKDESEKLKKHNNELASSNTEIQNKIYQSVGRMEELDLKEKDWEVIMGNEVADFRVEKTKLETQLTDLKTQVLIYESKKETLIKDIELLLILHDRHFGHAEMLNKVVDRVTRISQDNMDKLNIFVSQLTPEMQKVFDLIEKNVKQTNYVINELPQIYFDLKRKSLTREKI